MKIFNIEVKENEAIIQIMNEKEWGTWTDFATIKDEDDCIYAERMIEGIHPYQPDSIFRIKLRIQGNVSYINKQ